MTRVRGPQPNLSYFAFTATPKSPTLKLFGTFDPDKVNPRTGERGMHVPFHVYSMKQAIEEASSSTCSPTTSPTTPSGGCGTPPSSRPSRAANPEVDERKARAKLVRFAELHPTRCSRRPS